mgnify:FL=1
MKEHGQIWKFENCPDMLIFKTPSHGYAIIYDGIDLGPPQSNEFEIISGTQDQDTCLGWLFEQQNNTELEISSDEEAAPQPQRSEEENLNAVDALFRELDPTTAETEHYNPPQASNQYQHETVANRIAFFEQTARAIATEREAANAPYPMTSPTPTITSPPPLPTPPQLGW